MGRIFERRAKSQFYLHLKRRFQFVGRDVKIDSVNLNCQYRFFILWKRISYNCRKAGEFRKLNLGKSAVGQMQIISKILCARKVIAAKFEIWSLQRKYFCRILQRVSFISQRVVLAQNVCAGSLYLRAFGWWGFKNGYNRRNLDKSLQVWKIFQLRKAINIWKSAAAAGQNRLLFATQRFQDSNVKRLFKKWRERLFAKLKLELRLITLQQRLEDFSRFKVKRSFDG